MLRKIIYSDIEALDNYISSIEGYVYEEANLKTKTINEKEGGVSIGGSKSSINGKLGKNSETEETINVKMTDAVKLDKIIKYLSKEDELKYYEFLTQEEFENLRRSEFIEVLVTPRYSKLEQLSDTADQIKNLSDLMINLTGSHIVDESLEDSINGLKSLTNVKNTSLLSCVFNFESQDFPLVGQIDIKYLKIPKNEFASRPYTMLCKIQSKIEKGKKICLDEIFESMEYFSQNREQRRKMKTSMSNPDAIRDEINGPALSIIPVAIYQ